MYGCNLYGQSPFGSNSGISGYKIIAEPAQFSNIGTTAEIISSRLLPCTSAQYALSGVPLSLKKNLLLVTPVSEFLLTGEAASLSRTLKLAAGTSSYVLTSSNSGLTARRNLIADLIEISVTGYDIAYHKGKIVSLAAGTFELNPSIINSAWVHKLNCERASYEIIGPKIKLNGRLDLPGAPLIQIGDYFIDLPYCQAFAQAFLPDFGPIKKIFSSGRLYRELKGFYYSAQLDYSKYSNAYTLSFLQNLYKVRNSPFRFYPFNNKPYLSYNCELDAETALQLAQLPFNQGHQGLIIKLTGTDRLKQVDLEGGVALMDTQEQAILDDSGNAILGGLL